MRQGARSLFGRSGKGEGRRFPVRYLAVAAGGVIEAAAIIACAVLACAVIPHFWVVAWVVQAVCAVRIVASDDNPDYKLPWLLFVVALPVIGVTLYLMFYSRKLSPGYIRRALSHQGEYDYDHSIAISELKEKDEVAFSQVKMLCEISGSHLFSGTDMQYFPLGEELFDGLIEDVQHAERFIFLEYFIIKEGLLWDRLFAALCSRAAVGVEVRLLYDDVGCMPTLPKDFEEKLAMHGITAVAFSKIKIWADGRINNRNHRKLAVIDGAVAYTGGVNIGDEYVNIKPRFGHWKDGGLRLKGPAVWEITRLFLTDFGLSCKKSVDFIGELYPACDSDATGFAVPYGDGPKPIFRHNVTKLVIQNLLATATRYAYFTSPYLIMDNELCKSFERAAMRGVDVRIVLPFVPDKKLVFSVTRSFYPRLTACGVSVYEYTPGFMHAKNCVCDDRWAIVGSANLDYRSLAHHFECGVLIYGAECVKDVLADFDRILEKSKKVAENTQKTGFFERIGRAIARIFAPLL